MAGLDQAKNVDLSKRAEELAREAEQLREAGDSNADRMSGPDADKKLSDSIETLRKIARGD